MSQLSLIKQPAETQHHNKRSRDFTNILAAQKESDFFFFIFFFFLSIFFSLWAWLNISCFQLSRKVLRSLPLLLSCWQLHFSRPSPGPGVTQKWEDLCGPGTWARNASAVAACPSRLVPSLQAWGGTMLMAAPTPGSLTGPQGLMTCGFLFADKVRRKLSTAGK